MSMDLKMVLESKAAGLRCPTHITLELKGGLATDSLLVRCHVLPNCIQGRKWSVAYYTWVGLRMALLVTRKLHQCLELLRTERAPGPKH
jgi:hypothetical protein